MLRTFKLLTLLLALPLVSQAQYIIKKTDNFLYRRETSLGLIFNTNGSSLLSGLSIKHSRVIARRWYHIFYFDMSQIKESQEERTTSPITQNSYVANKLNYLFNVRLHYGREFILFKKAKKNGIQVDALAAGGLNVGIVAPYFIEYFDRINAPPKKVRYDPNIHANSNIGGYSGIIPAFGQSKYIPGISLRGAINFEFSPGITSTTGLEVGFDLNLFAETILIVKDVRERRFFPSLYILLYFGQRK